MEKICPRCNAHFECRHDNLKDCWCVNVLLDAQQLEYIGNNYADCLCHSCLQDIKINPIFSKKQLNNSLSIN